MAPSSLSCYPGCVGSSPQDVADGSAAPAVSSPQDGIQRPREGFSPHVSLFKTGEPFLGPSCPQAHPLHLPGQNQGTQPSLQPSWKGKRLAHLTSHTPGLRVPEPPLRPRLPTRVPRVRKTEESSWNGLQWHWFNDGCICLCFIKV